MLALCWLPVAADDGGSPHGPALDNPDAQIVVTPAAPSVGKGSTMRVNVDYIYDPAWGLYGFDVLLHFDTTHLQVIDACPYSGICPSGVQVYTGPLLDAWNNSYFRNVASNTEGTINYVHHGVAPDAEIYASGVMLYFEVTAVDVGLTCIEVITSTLSNIDGQRIPHTAATGCFNVFDPTAVTVSSFTASGGSNAVTLNWVTASEADNLGFNVYRAETADSARTRVNQALIPSLVNPGSPTGARYTYVDARIDKTRQAYYYWLESVDTRGHGELHGPVVATLPVPPLKLPPPLDPPDTK